MDGTSSRRYLENIGVEIMEQKGSQMNLMTECLQTFGFINEFIDEIRSIEEERVDQSS